MDQQLIAKKLEMWRKKLSQLEKEFVEANKKKGDAAQMGDLSENAAYKYAIEEIDMVQSRMADVKKIIADLEQKEK